MAAIAADSGLRGDMGGALPGAGSRLFCEGERLAGGWDRSGCGGAFVKPKASRVREGSPHPERRPTDRIFRQIVIEPRVRNVRCLEERPKMSGVVGGNGDRNDDTEG